MKQLFMVGLGGKAKNANIEVHDVQFVIGESIDDTLVTLKSNWYGLSKKLHMDSYKTIEGADGYRVIIHDTKADDSLLDKEEELSLFLVNVGGYDPKSFLEIHRIGLFAGVSANEARAKAKKVLFEEDVQAHIDNVVDVNDVLKLNYNGQYSLSLVTSEDIYDIVPEWFGYKRLDIV